MQPQSQSTTEMSKELMSDAKGMGAKAADRLHSEADARKSDVADQAKSVSGAIERLADNLDPETPNWLKTALQQGAQQVQTFANTIEQKDSRELLHDVSDFARKSPATFLGACAAVGFAAARLLKAGADSGTGVGGQPTMAAGAGPADMVDQQAAADPAFAFRGDHTDALERFSR